MKAVIASASVRAVAVLQVGPHFHALAVAADSDFSCPGDRHKTGYCLRLLLVAHNNAG